MADPLLHPRTGGWHFREQDGFVIHEDAPGDAHLAFAAAVVRGLDARPRRLEPRFIYDALGSEIYEAITELPEYYPTRTEDAILASCAPALAQRVGPTTLVELGSGSSTKTRRLLDGWTAAHGDVSYVPIDVSVTAVEGACNDLRARYPNLRVEGIAGTFQRGLDVVADLNPKTLLFLGSTLGNFEPDEVDAFFRQISGVTSIGDYFVLGVDLAKSPGILEPAYDDSAGLTEQFILNVFTRMNRELGTGVELDAFEMQSFYDTERSRIEMWAHVKRDQQITVVPLSRTFRLAGGERILVEVSRKFTVDRIREEASRYDLLLREVYQDAAGHFAVVLLQRAEGVPWQALTNRHIPAPQRPEASPVGQWRLVPAGPALLGEPPSSKDVSAMRLAAAPVTCGEYRAFVQAGGYADPALWSESGWAWATSAAAEAPLGWERGPEERWRVRGAPLDYLEPVSGVCFWEAEAYARWAGVRLPTEAEWEKGAAWDPEHGRPQTWPWGELPPDPRRVNAGGGLQNPVAVGSYPQSVSFYGLHQALGDVWEWVCGEEGPVLRGGGRSSRPFRSSNAACGVLRAQCIVRRPPASAWRATHERCGVDRSAARGGGHRPRVPVVRARWGGPNGRRGLVPRGPGSGVRGGPVCVERGSVAGGGAPWADRDGVVGGDAPGGGRVPLGRRPA